MKFTETPLAGAFVVELEPHFDDRGFFARGWCQNEFKEQGLVDRICQINVSVNHKAGTLRGMHYQVPPHAETKLIRCLQGALYDVVIDLRDDSPTCGQTFGIVLTAENRKMLYVPERFAHGFITLSENTEAIYQVSEFYAPGSERGIRHDDPQFGIQWPSPVAVISEKDQNWPDYKSTD